MLLPFLDLRVVRRWAESSQQGSRRNAMIASSALTQRRREHQEVEELFAARYGGQSRAPRTARAGSRGAAAGVVRG
ncbi:hypothetical protein ACFP3Q_16495 [Nocardioides sp. GCM10027113]|uniref:hypothetical protein n=1 Tax=unclassified Nocardioides TaxID=2615069 RepID=UPI00361D1CE7